MWYTFLGKNKFAYMENTLHKPSKIIPEIKPGESAYSFSREKELTFRAVYMIQQVIAGDVGIDTNLSELQNQIQNPTVAENIKQFLKLKFDQFSSVKNQELELKLDKDGKQIDQILILNEIANSLFGTTNFLSNDLVVKFAPNPAPKSYLQGNIITISRKNQKPVLVANNRLTDLSHDVLSHGVYAKIIQDIGIILPISFSELDEALIRGIDRGLLEPRRYKNALKRQKNLQNFDIHNNNIKVEDQGFEYDFEKQFQDEYLQRE
jgi:hypothetical protein